MLFGALFVCTCIFLSSAQGQTGRCDEADGGCNLFERQRTFRDCLVEAKLSPLWRGDETFAAAIRPWNLNFTSDPLAFIQPETSDLVGAAVSCAAQHGVTVTPRSGGHSYAGYSRGMDDGLVIDLAQLQDITVVDEAEKLVWLGAGNRMGRIMYELFHKYNLALPVGTCQAVGLGGFVLGGGQGVFSREHGFFSDRIVQYEIVRSDGRLFNITEENNPLLFTNLQGSGGSQFVIVTGVLAKAFTPAPKYTTIIFEGLLTSFAGIAGAYSVFADSANHQLGAFLGVSPQGVSNTFVGSAPKNETLEMLSEYIEATTGMLAQSSFLEGNILDVYYNYSSTYYPVANVEDLNYAANYVPASAYAHIKSDFTEINTQPNVAALDAITLLLLPLTEISPMSTSVVNIELTGGQMNNKTRSSVIVPRNTKLLTEFCIANNNTLTDVQNNWIRDIWEAYLPSAGNSSYVNFQDPDLLGKPERYWGQYLPALREIRPFYDPMDRFQFPFSFQRI